MARVSNELMAKRAEPVRDALRDFVKAKLKTLDERKQLAKYMGTSIHYINSMLYRGEGGLDAWISAISFCLNLDPKELATFLRERSPRNSTPQKSPSDRLWHDLDKILKPKQKLWWARILRAAVVESRKQREEGHS